MGKLYGDHYTDIDISSLKFIGQGTQGKVYFLPPNKVIKIFHSMHSCKDQLYILQCAKNSRFFPKVYYHDDFSIVMDFVPGVNLREYLKENKLSKELAFELVELICEFERLGFTRLDMRAPHIFVQADESVIAIDPRKSFQIVQKYPVSMLKTLKKNGALDEFFRLIKYRYNDKYSEWRNL